MEFEGKVILHTVGHFFEGYYAAQFLFGGCSRETKIWKILQSHVWNIRHHLGISTVYLRRKFSWKIPYSEATIKFFFITLLNFIRHAFARLDPSSPLSSNYGLVKVDFFFWRSSTSSCCSFSACVRVLFRHSLFFAEMIEYRVMLSWHVASTIFEA